MFSISILQRGCIRIRLMFGICIRLMFCICILQMFGIYIRQMFSKSIRQRGCILLQLPIVLNLLAIGSVQFVPIFGQNN